MFSESDGQVVLSRSREERRRFADVQWVLAYYIHIRSAMCGCSFGMVPQEVAKRLTEPTTSKQAVG